MFWRRGIQENKKIYCFLLDIIYKALEHAPFLLASVATFAGKVDGNQLRLVWIVFQYYTPEI